MSHFKVGVITKNGTEEEKEFKNSYENICKEYNDYYLTVVDCHI